MIVMGYIETFKTEIIKRSESSDYPIAIKEWFDTYERSYAYENETFW